MRESLIYIMKSFAHDDGEVQNVRKTTGAAVRPPPYAINALALTACVDYCAGLPVPADGTPASNVIGSSK